jgi:hypothetical protein
MEHARPPVRTSGARLRRGAALAILLALVVAPLERAAAQMPSYAFAGTIGSTNNEQLTAMARDAGGNVYLAGAFRGTVDFDPGAGTTTLTSSGSTTGDLDLYVASYDALGGFRWAFRVGSGGLTQVFSLTVDGGGNVLVTGQSATATDFDPGAGTATRAAGTFVGRYSPAGAHLWSFSLGTGPGIQDIAVDAAGNAVVTGSFTGSVDLDPGAGKATLSAVKAPGNPQFPTSDVFVAKYSPTGAYLWAFRVGGTGWESGTALDVDGSGNIYVTGFFRGATDFNPSNATNTLTPSGYGDVFVARYSSGGAYTWAFRLGGASPDFLDEATTIDVDAAGNAAVTGSFFQSADFDPGAGNATLSAVGTAANMYIARYSVAGAYQSVLSPGQGSARTVEIQSNGDLLVGGSFKGAHDFDPGSGTVVLPTNAAGIGGFAAKYTASGAYAWAFSLTVPVHNPVVNGIAGDGSGGIQVAGLFDDVIDLDPGDGSAIFASAGVADIFLATYTEALLPKPAGRAPANDRRTTFPTGRAIELH